MTAAGGSRKFIGKPMPLVEDRRFVRGRGRYINDLEFAGLFHMAVAPAPVAHARLLSVDVSAARKVPGVVAILTGADLIERMDPIPQELDLPNLRWYPLTTDKIRYIGEWTAAVVATSRAAAEDAAELVDLEYEELAPVVDPEAAASTHAAILHEAHGSNVVWDESNDWGDVESAFARADRVFEYRFRWNRHSGVPLETFGAVASLQPNGMLDIWASHQNPGIQREMARVLRWRALRVHMDVDVGGSYGSKRGRKQMYLAALAAIETGHPVKFMEDRIENMQAGDGHGPDRVYQVRVAADLDGTIRGLDFHLIEDLGAYCGRGPRQMTKPTAAVVGPYKVPAVRYSGLGVLTCKTNQVPFRGAGQSPHNFCLERAIDRVAGELGLDPVEIRLKNYIQPDQFPYEIPSGAVYDSGNFPGVCQLALETADLPRLRAEQAAARRSGRLVGIGLAGGLEPSGGAVDTGEGARIQIDENAKVIVTIGFQSSGQAHESMVTQIACEELGVSPDDVMVERGHGLSGIVGGATTGSRMTLMLGSATKAACDKLRAKLVTLAAHRLGISQAEICQDGRIFAKRGSRGTVLDLTELARIAYGARKNRPADMEPGLVEQAVFPGPQILHKNLRKGAKAFPSYAFDFHVVQAEVDPETFQITLHRIVVVHDCGTVLNPLVVDGFVYGGIGHGVGGALYEHFLYDESGQLATASFMDYLMPTAAEVPRVELRSLETPSPLHPYGAKGSAEGSYMTAPAAIASAVEDAVAQLGISINEIPITPKLLYEGWTAANRTIRRAAPDRDDTPEAVGR